MAIFGLQGRAGATHIVQVGSVGAFAPEASAPQPSEHFAKVTPEHFGKLTPHLRRRFSRACFRTDRRGCAAHSYGTVAVLYDVSLHTNLLRAGSCLPLLLKRDVGRGTHEDAYERVVR